MRSRRIIALLLSLLLLASLALSACTQSEPEPQPEPAEEPQETAEEPEEPEIPPEPEEPIEPAKPEPVWFTNPLSGEKTEKDLSNLRPYAVMINNKREALPQLGVSQADIIYEVCAEGGITRMEAIFQDVEGIEALGSIRSIRPYYIELATAYDSIVIHAGGSEEAYYDLRVWGINHFDGVRGGYDANIFWRDPYRMANAGYEHSMLTSGENILEYVNSTSIRQEHEEGYEPPLTFTDENMAGQGERAESVTVHFSTYKTDVFTYDPETDLYLVEGHGQEYIDGNTGEQVGVRNVLVLNTSSQVLDSEGRLRVVTVGTGSGTYFCGGKAVPITWGRDTRDDAFRYALENGQPLSFVPGKTYICLINPYVSEMGYE